MSTNAIITNDPVKAAKQTKHHKLGAVDKDQRIDLLFSNDSN